MSILDFALWLQSTPFFTELRLSSYLYPVVMSLHLAGMALFGGMILVTDLRLLGLAMNKRPVSDVIDQLRTPKRIGFLLVATCGILMLGSKAEEYYYNSFFRTKLVLLACIAVHALVFRAGVYGNAAELDRAQSLPAKAKLAASLSLLLWLGLIIAGRGIGYIDAPLNIHASTADLPVRNRPPGRLYREDSSISYNHEPAVQTGRERETHPNARVRSIH